MVGSSKQSELNKLRFQYVMKYLVNQGIDVHAYLGNKKKPSLPGFSLNKEEAVGNIDLRFNGPADVAAAMNFFAPKYQGQRSYLRIWTPRSTWESVLREG